MVIDDSPTVRKLVEVSLRQEGFDVVSFPDGIEALRAISTRQLEHFPDLVLLDINLPKLNGYEVARYLRSKPEWGQPIIVILSRYDGAIDRLKARLVGTQTYIPKPFTTQKLNDVVHSFLGD